MFPQVILLCETHHARAVAVVTLRHLGAWLVTLSITSWAAVINVHTQLLICTLCCFGKGKLHHILWKNRKFVNQGELGIHILTAYYKLDLYV